MEKPYVANPIGVSATETMSWEGSACSGASISRWKHTPKREAARIFLNDVCSSNLKTLTILAVAFLPEYITMTTIATATMLPPIVWNQPYQGYERPKMTAIAGSISTAILATIIVGRSR